MKFFFNIHDSALDLAILRDITEIVQLLLSHQKIKVNCLTIQKNHFF